MKRSKLTFSNFRGLDFRTTQESVAFTGKPNDVGFEEAYALIKQWIFHPLPNFQSIWSTAGRLFQVRNDLYLMETTGIKKWNWTSFVSFITQTFANNPAQWDVKPFFDITSTWAVTLGAIEEVGDQFIRYTNPIPINKYIGKHLGIGSGTSTQILNITGNDSTTIFLDGMINWSLIDTGITATYVYDKIPVLVIYDWSVVRRFDASTGASYWTVKTISNWFIEVFANRLFVMANNQIEFSTFNSATLLNQDNFIDTEWIIVDKQIIGNSLVVFTSKWTFAITGTGYTSMNFPKVSEFSPNEKIFPVSHIDNTYISHEWYIRRFTTGDGLLQTQYNYMLIPDTQKEIFSIERGIIFSLWHGSNKYWILNVEELQNRRIVTITNFRDANIWDILEFKGTIFMISWGTLYKENWTRDITVKTNNIRSNRKLYWELVDINLSGTHPNTITAKRDWWTKTPTKNTAGNQTSYNIREMSNDIQISFTANNPVIDFNIYYKY